MLLIPYLLVLFIETCWDGASDCGGLLAYRMCWFLGSVTIEVLSDYDYYRPV